MSAQVGEAGNVKPAQDGKCGPHTDNRYKQDGSAADKGEKIV